MTTAFLITAIVLLILIFVAVLALCLPLVLRIRMENSDLTLVLYFWGIPIYRYPEKLRLQNGRVKKQNAPKKVTKTITQVPQSSDPEVLIRYAKELVTEFLKFTSRSKAKLHQLVVVSPGEDAAKAALLYTAVSGGVAAILELLDQHTQLTIASRDAVRIIPNYTNEESRFSLELCLSFPAHHALSSISQFAQRLQSIQ